ncbi:MAG: class II glutamine amidotransferase [Candidatus Marinimicrobia bacterium]|nr:class II glutamine amidotransferase [Candidatus Neomarinimicrobiota bacterium]
MKFKSFSGLLLILSMTSSVLPCRMLGVITLPDHSLSNRDSNGNFNTYLMAELEELRLQGGSGNWPYNNRDGWAMTSFSRSADNIEVQTIRSELEAFEDVDYYQKTALLLAGENVPILIGHLRQTSSGAGEIANPHPFVYTDTHGQTFSFAHNGDLNKTDLRELIGDIWLNAHPPQTFGGSPWNADGWSRVVDSELFFFWIVKNVEASGSMLEGITQALRSLEEQQPYNIKNFLLSDGQDLYAYRRSPAKDIHYFDGSNGGELPWYLQNSNHRAIMSTPPPSGLLSTIPWVELEDRQLLILKADGSSELHQPLRQNESEEPDNFPEEPWLSKAYPNPFNGITIIPVLFKREGLYNMTIFDSYGKQVFKTLTEHYQLGKNDFSWSGQDDYGNALPSGCYFYKIGGSQLIATGKLLYLK